MDAFPFPLDNHDSRLRYYPLRMVLEESVPIPHYALPTGYRLVYYQPGDRDRWIEIERSARELDDYAQGLAVWARYFAPFEHLLPQRMLFVENAAGEKVATASAYFNPELPDGDGWLHWVAVHREAQGQGLSRPLITAALHRLRSLGYGKLFLSTQTTSWVAVRLYLELGFLPTAESLRDSAYGWQMMKTLTSHPSLFDIKPLPFPAILQENS